MSRPIPPGYKTKNWLACHEALQQRGSLTGDKPWSNGQIEAQINRLKTLKRQMYGRANIDLLRARLVTAS